MLELFNQLRASYSIKPLELNKQLNYIAQTHCIDMAKRGFFAHLCPDGKNVTARAIAVDYNAVVTELISDALTPEEAFEQWSGNGALKSQLLNDNNQRLGIGLFGGKWTVVMGLPAASTTVVVRSANELQSELEGLINKLRTEAKVPPVKGHAGLQKIVDGHAVDMAAKNFLAYEHPECIGIPGRVRESGYRGRFFPAITKGPTTAEAVFKLFADSPGHRKNLVDPEFRDVAISGKDGVWVLLLGAPAPEIGGDLRSDLLRLINAQRAASSAPPMSQSSLLNHVSQDYAQDMVRRTFFAYTNPEGKGPDALAKSDGFPGRLFPTLARGATAPEVALQAWLKSPQTRTALLDPQFTLIGIGMSEAHWVLLLGAATP